MINWEDELKKYISKKFEKETGKKLPVEDIKSFEVQMDVPVESLSLKDIAYLYAFAIMKEDFENAKRFKDELQKRNCVVEIDIDENNKVGVMNIFHKPQQSLAEIQINLKVHPQGMMIDFDKADF